MHAPEFTVLLDFADKFPPQGDTPPTLLSTAEIFRIIGQQFPGFDPGFDLIEWLKQQEYQTDICTTPEIGIKWKTYPSFEEE